MAGKFIMPDTVQNYCWAVDPPTESQQKGCTGLYSYRTVAAGDGEDESTEKSKKFPKNEAALIIYLKVEILTSLPIFQNQQVKLAHWTEVAFKIGEGWEEPGVSGVVIRGLGKKNI